MPHDDAGEFGDDEGVPAASQQRAAALARPVKPPPALCLKLDWLRSKTINEVSTPSMFFCGALAVYLSELQTPALEHQLQFLPDTSTLAAAGCGSPRATAHSDHSLVTSATSCAGKKTPGSRCCTLRHEAAALSPPNYTSTRLSPALPPRLSAQ